MFFKPYEFISNLSYMGIGMATIGIIIGIIILITVILCKASSGKKQ